MPSPPPNGALKVLPPSFKRLNSEYAVHVPTGIKVLTETGEVSINVKDMKLPWYQVLLKGTAGTNWVMLDDEDFWKVVHRVKSELCGVCSKVCDIFSYEGTLKDHYEDNEKCMARTHSNRFVSCRLDLSSTESFYLVAAQFYYMSNDSERIEINRLQNLMENEIVRLGGKIPTNRSPRSILYPRKTGHAGPSTESLPKKRRSRANPSPEPESTVLENEEDGDQEPEDAENEDNTEQGHVQDDQEEPSPKKAKTAPSSKSTATSKSPVTATTTNGSREDNPQDKAQTLPTSLMREGDPEYNSMITEIAESMEEYIERAITNSNDDFEDDAFAHNPRMRDWISGYMTNPTISTTVLPFVLLDCVAGELYDVEKAIFDHFRFMLSAEGPKLTVFDDEKSCELLLTLSNDAEEGWSVSVSLEKMGSEDEIFSFNGTLDARALSFAQMCQALVVFEALAYTIMERLSSKLPMPPRFEMCSLMDHCFQKMKPDEVAATKILRKKLLYHTAKWN